MLPVVARLVVPVGLEVGVGDVCWGVVGGRGVGGVG